MRNAKDTLLIENNLRPPIQVWGNKGMVVSMHPIASAVGADVLKQGGNAIDAAIAVGAAISVTSHDWAGIAGDSAWLIYQASLDNYLYLDGYSSCPRHLTSNALIEYFDLAGNDAAALEEPHGLRDHGIATSLIPGTPGAWEMAHKRLGHLSWAELLQPAIDIAARGFTVNRYFEAALKKKSSKFINFSSTRKIFTKDDKTVWGEGDLLRQPDLARTLARYQQFGSEGFYKGETATLIAEYCRKNGGFITQSDLALYEPKWRAVVSGRYRSSDVYSTTAPTAGTHLIQALNLLSQFDLKGLTYHSPQSLHILVECLKLALASRRESAGDPDYVVEDVNELTSAKLTNSLRLKVTPSSVLRLAAQRYSSSSTTHFAVADSMGNMVSATQTIGSGFGCGEIVEGTGLLLNDRSWWMGLRDGPNIVAPGRRANIGHAPTILARNGKAYAALGSPGGFGIVQYIVQVIINMVDYGLDIQNAIEAPRFKIEDLSGSVGFESRINSDVLTSLIKLGHEVFEYPAWTDEVGGVEGLEINTKRNAILAGYDPRRNSYALGI